MKIVTAGNKYIDIDAYASCIAYANLLKLKGIHAKAVSTAKINETITPNLLKLNAQLENYEKSDNDEFIIVDVSSKSYFDNIVNEDKIIEIIDHHVGYEEYWKQTRGKSKNRIYRSGSNIDCGIIRKRKFDRENVKRYCLFINVCDFG